MESQPIPVRDGAGKLEKEAQLVVNEILAKLNQNEKIIGGGAIAILVGWILGLILTSSGGVSWYGQSGAQASGLLAILAGIAAVVVIYLKYAPNVKITWPAPITLILLVIAVIAALAALGGLLQALMYDPYAGLSGAYCNLASSYGVTCPTKPITIYLAAIVVLAGGAAMAYGAYMEYSANKTPAA
jgi:ABC-type Fe3+-siderophore transport system permease subunit